MVMHAPFPASRSLPSRPENSRFTFPVPGFPAGNSRKANPAKSRQVIDIKRKSEICSVPGSRAGFSGKIVIFQRFPLPATLYILRIYGRVLGTHAHTKQEVTCFPPGNSVTGAPTILTPDPIHMTRRRPCRATPRHVGTTAKYSARSRSGKSRPQPARRSVSSAGRHAAPTVGSGSTSRTRLAFPSIPVDAAIPVAGQERLRPCHLDTSRCAIGTTAARNERPPETQETGGGDFLQERRRHPHHEASR